MIIYDSAVPIEVISIMDYCYNKSLDMKDFKKRNMLLAIEGDQHALCNLGLYFMSIEENYNEAVKCYEIALQSKMKNDCNVINNLGTCYKDLHEYDKAKEMFLQGVEKGDVNSINNLASCYLNTGDNVNAKKYYEMGIEKNNYEAYCGLGYYYYTVEHNEQKGIEYLQISIDGGCTRAYYALGILSSDKEQAKKYFEQGAEKNNSLCCHELGKYYYLEKGDNKKAEEWYLKAIHLGSHASMNNLGVMLYKNDKIKEGLKYLELAASIGSKEAMQNLGKIYYKNDVSKSIDCFKSAALRGCVDSMYFLALHYYSKHDIDNFFKYHNEAVEKNHTPSMIKLGDYYASTKNTEFAIKYYLMALKLNDILAGEQLKKITSELERYVLYKKNAIQFNEPITSKINIYINKINLLSKEDDCMICLSTEKCIPFECCHYICTNCYPIQIKSRLCPICKTTISS